MNILYDNYYSMSFEGFSSFESSKEAELKKASPLDIKKAEESVKNWLKLQNINDILDNFDLPEAEENGYRKTLQKLDKEELNNLANKPKNEVLPILIQTQINELEQSANPDFDKLDQLQKQLIALENQKQTIQQEAITAENQKQVEQKKTIAEENQKQETIRTSQDSRLRALETALSLENLNLANNPKMQKIQDFFAEYKKLERTDEAWKQTTIDNLIGYLQEEWTIESIATDLWWVDSQEYQKFKASLIQIEPNLRENFEKAEYNLVSNYAKVKLWTNDLRWVNLENDTLLKTEWNLTIEAGKDIRNLSLVDSEYKLASKLDTNYENQIIELNNQSTEKLKPLNSQLTNAENITNFLAKNEVNWVDFATTKLQIKNSYPEIYNELWIGNNNSYDEVNFNLQILKISLEEEINKITQNTKIKMEQIVLQNTKEAKEKDKLKKDLLEFFHDIGFDILSQVKTDILIDYINRNISTLWLSEPINLENWSIGFNKDFGDKEISIAEKMAFIELFNKILGKDIIDKNIAKNTTTLSLEAMMQIQVLGNRNVGYFVGNLEKGENI